VPKTPIRRSSPRQRTSRSKLDPRLAYLLSLGPQKLMKLHAEETSALQLIEKDLFVSDSERDGSRKRPPRAGKQLFSPLTTGVYFPSKRGEPARPIRLREPWFSCFILSDASAQDPARLVFESAVSSATS
jgi:hypothetical protein